MFSQQETDFLLYEYAKSKGVPRSYKNNAMKALHSQLIHEYGFIAPALKSKNRIQIDNLEVEKIQGHPRYMSSVEERAPAPLSNGLLVIGVVIPHDDYYRIVDGYHRLKWAKNNNLEEAVFIILS